MEKYTINFGILALDLLCPGFIGIANTHSKCPAYNKDYLDSEFGPGTLDLIKRLSTRQKITVIIQINLFCRDAVSMAIPLFNHKRITAWQIE